MYAVHEDFDEVYLLVMPIKQVPRARDKKKDLLARKEEILSNIKYYEQRIKEDSAAVESTQNFVDRYVLSYFAHFRTSLCVADLYVASLIKIQ